MLAELDCDVGVAELQMNFTESPMPHSRSDGMNIQESRSCVYLSKSTSPTFQRGGKWETIRLGASKRVEEVPKKGWLESAPIQLSA